MVDGLQMLAVKQIYIGKMDMPEGERLTLLLKPIFGQQQNCYIMVWNEVGICIHI